MSALGEAAPAARSSITQWPAIFAGAIGAAGISFTLHAFASGVGLAAFSTAPTWRDMSIGLVILTGLYVLFVAIVAFGVGGYITGRMRTAQAVSGREAEFRDGMNGVITWSLAIVLSALLALAAASIASPAVAPSGGTAGAAQSVAGENIIVSELDELFRSPNGFPDSYRRAEAARILLKASSHDGVPRADKDYLAGIVSRVSGTPMEESLARVDRAVVASTVELRNAREVAVTQAFIIGAALFIGVIVAWFAAEEGGRERDAGALPTWDWQWRRRVYKTNV